MKVKEDKWIELLNATLQGVLALLHTVKVVLDSDRHDSNDVTVAAGVYTFAIEEYGKLATLLELRPKDGMVTIDFWSMFGPRSHNTKFKKSFETLPRECFVVSKGVFSSAFDSRAFSVATEADFEARKRVFYAGLDKSGMGVVPTPSVDEGLLRSATARLDEVTMSTVIPSKRTSQ